MESKSKQPESGKNAKLLKAIEAFLFRGMRACLNRKAVWTPIPRGNIFKHKEGDFRLEVQYELLEENKMSGKVSLFLKDVCVWEVTCSGFYSERDVPLLIRAWRKAYAKDEFFGGRGDIVEYRSKLNGSIRICENRPFAGDFKKFGGSEKVTVVRGGDECQSNRPITTLLIYFGGKKDIKDIHPTHQQIPVVDLFFNIGEQMMKMFLPRAR
ncbi:MAG: hypothetical protein WAV50_00800 [Minisyncoccia bacterium]